MIWMQNLVHKLSKDILSLANTGNQNTPPHTHTPTLLSFAKNAYLPVQCREILQAWTNIKWTPPENLVTLTHGPWPVISFSRSSQVDFEFCTVSTPVNCEVWSYMGDMHKGTDSEVERMIFIDPTTFPGSTQVNNLWWRHIPFSEFRCSALRCWISLGTWHSLSPACLLCCLVS